MHCLICCYDICSICYDLCNRSRASTVIGITCNVACLLAIIIRPYMPNISKIMAEQMNASEDLFVLTEDVNILLPEGHKIGKVRRDLLIPFFKRQIIIFLCLACPYIHENRNWYRRNVEKDVLRTSNIASQRSN